MPYLIEKLPGCPRDGLANVQTTTDQNFISSKTDHIYKGQMTAICDLAASAREHIELLRSVHLCERDLYHQGDDLSQAITAYVNSWLPALSSCTDESALELPALDVAWVWHLHKTDPASYQRDCARWFGRVLDLPHGVSPFQHSSSLSAPQKLLESESCSEIDTDFLQRIESSAENQSSFLWQVNWPEYEHCAFLEESVRRYEMMLELMKKHPRQFIVPTYDIDNIWHTHLAFPSRYKADCKRIAGREINHDDSVNDRSSGSFLNKSSAETERLWNETFSTPWRKKGAMFRGKPPSWYWSDRRQAAARPVLVEPSLPNLQTEHNLGYFAQCAIAVIGRAFGTAGNTEVCPQLPYFAFLMHCRHDMIHRLQTFDFKATHPISPSRLFSLRTHRTAAQSCH
jgi:hypothetical protein